MNNKIILEKRKNIKQIEESVSFAPKFDRDGLIPVVTTDYKTGEVLMQGFMNEEALKLTIEKSEVIYYSRSRNRLWHKGKISGFIQKVKEMLIDDDQDCIWVKVIVDGGASCHVGYRSCFYRSIPFGKELEKKSKLDLKFTEKEKVFDPDEIYKNETNPTK